MATPGEDSGCFALFLTEPLHLFQPEENDPCKHGGGRTPWRHLPTN